MPQGTTGARTGSCTRMPLILGSALNVLTLASTSSCVAVSGSSLRAAAGVRASIR